MKNLIATIAGVTLFGLGFAINTIIDNVREDATATENMKETDTSYHVIETDKAIVEYWDIENGDFDILVTPKDGFNISPEFSLDDNKYYRDAYIVGKTKKQAKQHYDNANGKYGVKWEFSWNN